MMDGYGRFYTFSIQKWESQQNKADANKNSRRFWRVSKQRLVYWVFSGTGSEAFRRRASSYIFMPAQRRDKAGQTSGGDDGGASPSSFPFGLGAVDHIHIAENDAGSRSQWYSFQ